MKEKGIRYLKEKEVSELTGIAIQTLRNQRASKHPDTIPYIRIGKKIIRYDPRDVFEFMELHKVSLKPSENIAGIIDTGSIHTKIKFPPMEVTE